MTREIDYINARVRGYTSRLLPENDVSAMFEVGTRNVWTASLRETPYAPYLGPSVGDPDSRRLFDSIDRSVADRTRRLGRLADGRPAQALNVCLAEWDLGNLLSIVSGIYNRVPPSQVIPATLAGGLLEPDQLDTLSHCRTLIEVSDFLRLWHHPYQVLVRSVFKRHAGTSLPEIRLELSRQWTQKLLADARRTGYPTLSDLISRRVDQTNIMTALMWRVLPSDRSPEEFFLQGGGEVDLRRFRKILAAADVTEAISFLRSGHLRTVLEAAAARHDSEEGISALHQALEKDLTHQWSRPMARDPLGIGLMISFLMRLRREGVRLKLSLTRLIYDIPKDIFLEMTGNV